MRSSFHPPTLNLIHVLKRENRKVGEVFEISQRLYWGNLEATLTAGEGEKCFSGLQGW